MEDSLKKGLYSWAIKGVLYKAYVAAVLMISAGRWDWVDGWIYVGLFLAFDAATAITVIPRNPELLIERTSRNPDMKSWDKVIMPLAAGVLPLIGWILAGLGQRCPLAGATLQVGRFRTRTLFRGRRCLARLLL